MKKIILISLILAGLAASSQAMLFMPANGLGQGKSAVEGALSFPSNNVTEFTGDYTYGMNADTDVYGRLGTQTYFGTSSTIFGGGLKSCFMKADKSLPVDLAWLVDINYISWSEGGVGASATDMIGGVIASQKINQLTVYGLLGLNYSTYSAGGTAHSLCLGGGVIHPLSKNMNLKGEILVHNFSNSSTTGFGGAIQYLF